MWDNRNLLLFTWGEFKDRLVFTTLHWTNDEIGVAVQSWLWGRVELMAWELSRLKRLNEIQGSSVHISIKPTFYSSTFYSFYTSNNPSVVNTIYISSFNYTHVITSRKFQLNKHDDWRRKQPKGNLTLNKRWNWSSCIMLAPRVCWTHGLIAQSVRASERNSVVVGSNLTHANFL